VPGASTGYPKHLLSLKVMTSQTKQELHGPLKAGLGSMGINGSIKFMCGRVKI